MIRAKQTCTCYSRSSAYSDKVCVLYFVYRHFRPFLIQSDLSVENGLFWLKPKSGFLTQSKKGFSTQLFSTENSDWRIQSKNLVGKKFYTCFLNRPHRSSHHQTHTHTATHPYQVPHCSIMQGADAGLAIPAVASRKSAWRIPSFARQ